jgi:hypothetical protein
MRFPEPLSHETSELLRHEAALEPVPPELRRRVLARARFAQRVSAAPKVTLRSRLRYVVFGAIGLGCGALALAAVFRPSANINPVDPSLSSALSNVVPEAHSSSDGPGSPRLESEPGRTHATEASPLPSSGAKVSREGAAASKRDGDRADDELALLARARQSVAKGAYASAFTLINEHARRFPRGRLSEEREALRVTALWRTGRHAEARRAAAGFVRRFPRSVLAPQMAQRAAEGQ